MPAGSNFKLQKRISHIDKRDLPIDGDFIKVKESQKNTPTETIVRPRTRARHTETTWEISEDGDFVSVQEARKRRLLKQKEKHELNNSSESDDNSIPVDVTQQEKFTRVLSPINDDMVSKQIFEAVANSDFEKVEGIINKSGYDSFFSQPLREKSTGKNALHYALEIGNIEMASKLIDQANGITIRHMYVDSNGSKNVLHMATSLGNEELVKKILSKVPDKDEKIKFIKEETKVEIIGQRPRTFTSFHLSAFKGFTNLVELFLDEGIDIDTLNTKSDTALLWAARWGHKDTVSCLLKRNANVSLENDKKSTALHWAVRYEQKKTVELLLTLGKANPNQKRVMGLVAPLVLISAIGNYDIAKLLIIHGAEVNMVIRGGETSLHHACKEGHNKIVRLLISHGANITQEDEAGNSPLILAAKHDRKKVVKTLVKNGADMFHQNHHEQSAISIAMDLNDYAILEILAYHFLYLTKNNKTEDTKSPVIIATTTGKIKALQMLFSLGIDYNQVDVDGNTLIHHAAINNQCDVIEELHKRKVSLNAQNARMETALHIACAKGYAQVVDKLLALKAAANIGNKRGETALHITACSENTTPEIARAIVQHSIRSHDWESVNRADNFGNNALHLAAKFAVPDVLWEFRFVRFKDIDEDGNTPLHEAVRPGEPEALEKMLDIYEDMQRDADINMQNNLKETVLHLAASEGYTELVSRIIFYGGDITVQDNVGNTVLHRLVHKMTELDVGEETILLDTVKVIINNCVRWWCTRNSLKFPSDDQLMYNTLKREAILYLLNHVTNQSNYSVLGYAFKYGASEFINYVFNMPFVMKYKDKEIIYYDVTFMTPNTSANQKKGQNANQIDPIKKQVEENRNYQNFSNIEILMELQNKSRAEEVLNIGPVRQLERMYYYVCALAYGFFLILHVVYMSLYTAFGFQISAMFRNVSTISSDDGRLIAVYCIVPLEPLLLLAFTIAYVYRLIRKKDSIRKILFYIVIVVYIALSITWLILIAYKNTNHDYVLAITICLGWLGSLSFTRGFKKVHFFYKMLLHMIINDVVRFAVVFGIVLLAFGFAFHVLFQISASIADIYSSPGDTLFMAFNLMLGMSEIFDDSFSTGMSEAGRSEVYTKVFYLIYISLSAIILLNLLIAMMNDSYSAILKEQQVSWRMDSIQLGIGVEHLMPWFAEVFGVVKLHHIVPPWKEMAEKRWFLITNKATLEKYRPIRTQTSKIEKKILGIETRLADFEKFSEQMAAETSKQLQDIMQMLNSIQHQSSKTMDSEKKTK